MKKSWNSYKCRNNSFAGGLNFNYLLFVQKRDHLGDTERGASIYKVFLNTLVATSWNAFAGDIAVKSRDAIKLHQAKYNANSVIPHNVLASDYLTDCHQALFFQQDTLVY